MKVAALLYHDVVGEEGFAGSGFAGGDADIYKLTRPAFEAHLRAVSAVARHGGTIEALLAAPPASAVLFTFDDGGAGAVRHTAPLLEAMGWRGHFFVTTDRIGTPGFLDANEIRELHARGHVIGSHSRSHPPRISHLPAERLRAEWRDSVQRLEDVLGAPVRTASVPGGFYAPPVAAAAHAAGIEVLFTSEPTRRVGHAGGCTLIGRFSVMRDDDAALAAALAGGALFPRLRQAALWNAKKVVKRVGGAAWLAFRKRVLSTR